jgi:phosphohistidine phosphatase
MKTSEFNDEERRLLIKGETDTKFVTDYLRSHKVKLDLIITSHALRAVQTAKLFSAAFRYPEESIRTDHLLYYNGLEVLFNQFYDIPEHKKSVLIIGHNPSITTFANNFTDDKVDSLPLSGVIGIRFNISRWEDIIKTRGEECIRVFPKVVRKSVKYAALLIK